MFRIPKVLVVSAAIIAVMLMSEAALAAPFERSSYNWTGAYIGGFAGYSRFDLDYYEPDWPGNERNPEIDGLIAGPLTGYNYQTDSILFGIEVDTGFGDFHEDAERGALNNYSAFDIDWNAHVRARIGIVLDTTLLYVAGGLSIAEVTVDDTDWHWGEDNATHVGWTAGGGIEQAVTRNLRVRVEYLYDDYGSRDYTIDGYYPYRATVDLTAYSVRAGLSYNF